MDDMGKILNSHTVRFERLLPAPIEKVWDYISTAEGLAQWLCPDAAIEARIDGRVDLKMPVHPDSPPGGFRPRGFVINCEKPRLIEYSWIETAVDLSSSVRFELESQGDQVLLLITHTRICPDFMPKVGAGWHSHLVQLRAAVRGEEIPDHRPIFAEFLPKYAAAIAAAVVMSSTVLPAIAAPPGEAYKVVRDERARLLREYDRIWTEADYLQKQIDVLKRETRKSADSSLDDLDRDLKEKNSDLRKIELDISDLDKAVIAQH